VHATCLTAGATHLATPAAALLVWIQQCCSTAASVRLGPRIQTLRCCVQVWGLVARRSSAPRRLACWLCTHAACGNTARWRLAAAAALPQLLAARCMRQPPQQLLAALACAALLNGSLLTGKLASPREALSNVTKVCQGGHSNDNYTLH
jgi:hypothetical protein